MVLILVVGILAAGCEAGESDGPLYTSADSAGVLVVESRAPQWGETRGWSVEAEPSLVIGAESGAPEILFSRVAGAVRLEDGRIVVADGQTNELRWFGPDGSYLRTAGGPGEGPGEFQYLRALHRCAPDVLHAFDLNWQARLYSLEGEFLRSYRITEPGRERGPYSLGCYPGGPIAITGWDDGLDRTGGGPPWPMGFYAQEAPAWILNLEGAPIAELGTFVTSERIGSPGGSGPHPFGRAAAVASGPDGVAIARGHRMEAERYDASGRLVQLFRGPDPRLELRSEDVATWRETALEDVPPELMAMRRREMQEMPMPDSIPAVDRILVDVHGHLWLRYFRIPRSTGPEQWAVFAPEGIWLGRLETPESMEILDIGDDHVLGLHRDPLGVERVRLHRLDRN